MNSGDITCWLSSALCLLLLLHGEKLLEQLVAIC
jgi:hypothetical protein